MSSPNHQERFYISLPDRGADQSQLTGLNFLAQRAETIETFRMSCLNTLRLNLPILQGGDAALRHLQGDDLFEVTLGQGIHAAAFTGDELTEEDSHRTLELAPSTWPPEIK